MNEEPEKSTGFQIEKLLFLEATFLTFNCSDFFMRTEYLKVGLFSAESDICNCVMFVYENYAFDIFLGLDHLARQNLNKIFK